VEIHGVVYTKPWVVELMLDLAGYVAEQNLVDKLAVEPAAGDGSFLVPMAERLITSCRRQARPLIECTHSLLGHELDPASAGRARQALLSRLLSLNVAHAEADALARAWVRTGDYLLNARSLPPADLVIGNPPYIRLEDMLAGTLTRYRSLYKTMVARADLYVAFFEAALKQLKPGGVCAYICADRWMLNQYGAELRRLVTARFSVETVIEMHRADAFQLPVSAYPAITIVRRAPQGAAVVASVGSAVGADEPATIARALSVAREQGALVEPNSPNVRATRVESWFERDQPWPCVAPERLALLKRLEAEFYPLESVGTGTRVGIGVATGADDVFITTDEGLVESDRLLPLAMACDLKDGRLAWSRHYLINPWHSTGLADLNRFPRLQAYYDAHRDRLKGRHVGKKHESAWYRTIDRVDPRLLARPKLYIADIRNRLDPVLDSGVTYPHHNLYFVTSAGWDLETLGGLLLSEIGQFFVECYGVRMRGGYLRFQAQYLRRIRVPRPHDLTEVQRDGLALAFRTRDRERATRLALELYRIERLPEVDE
jgi:hypothetical protein